MSDLIYIVCPDGTVVWEPSPDDYELLREEELDLADDCCQG